MRARDTLYRVLTDSLPLGPMRCPRRDATKGKCCLCYWLRGVDVLETSGHLMHRCPYTREVHARVFRAFALCTFQPAKWARVRDMTAGEISCFFQRPLVTGLLLVDDDDDMTRRRPPRKKRSRTWWASPIKHIGPPAA